MNITDYHVASHKEMLELGYGYPDEREGKVLVGPDNFQCSLGELEDCSWFRDGSEVVLELNRLRDKIIQLGGEP